MWVTPSEGSKNSTAFSVTPTPRVGVSPHTGSLGSPERLSVGPVGSPTRICALVLPNDTYKHLGYTPGEVNFRPALAFASPVILYLHRNLP